MRRVKLARLPRIGCKIRKQKLVHKSERIVVLSATHRDLNYDIKQLTNCNRLGSRGVSKLAQPSAQGGKNTAIDIFVILVNTAILKSV
jgi:hypothetical protein